MEPTNNIIDLNSIKELMKNYKLWEIKENEIEYMSRLGTGHFGRVYRGKLSGSIPVAIKVFSPVRYEEYLYEFQTFQSLKGSPFLISFHGVSLVEEPFQKLCIILEYCSRDSLYDIMNNKLIDIGWHRFFQFSMQIILGLNSLHNFKPDQPIIHNDVSSLNILVNEYWECKVSNFGSCRSINLKFNNNKTYAYCSPESSDPDSSSITTKTDIYSFGIIIWELINRIINSEYSSPFSEYKNIKNDFQIIVLSKNDGLRPTLPPTCPEPLVNLYKSCVDNSPINRPTCEDIITSLNQIRSIYLSNSKSWDNLIIKK